MRLWHQDLLSVLPRAQILGQHRECCALRGLGWGKKHSTVDYVFTHSVIKLIHYHQLVIREMLKRGYKPDPFWSRPEYRGKNSLPWDCKSISEIDSAQDTLIYPEHDDAYYEECLKNLRKKGVELIHSPQRRKFE